MVVFRKRPDGKREYLMICRKDTLGYVDFIRGKYSVYNKNYLLNMMTQMTAAEKHKLRTLTFDGIWHDLWCHPVDVSLPEFQRNDEAILAEKRGIISAATSNSTAMKKIEDLYLKDRFHLLICGIYSKNSFYTLNSLLDESDKIKPAEGGENYSWTEPEWGFPKGRKNYQEKDLHCALREFEEETGYSMKHVKVIENILPFEEIFTGSNYKSYKHKYFLGCMDAAAPETPPYVEKGEVSKVGWFTLEECLEKIRPYNVEKRKLICNINNILEKYRLA
jgi:ADP-ribose pyrophosphatase YjhB (NUDIX family)